MRNVLTLAVAGFFAAFGQVTMVVLAGIIGALLAPAPQVATLPVMVLAVGHPASDARIPRVAKRKKPLEEILSHFD